VNQYLGAKPALGPIPADQVLPWAGIIVGVYVGGSFFGANYGQMAFLAALFCSTWWSLTGAKPYRYLGKWLVPPVWVRVGVPCDELPDVTVRRVRAQNAPDL